MKKTRKEKNFRMQKVFLQAIFLRSHFKIWPEKTENYFTLLESSSQGFLHFSAKQLFRDTLYGIELT